MGSIRARNETGRLFFEFRYQGKRCREQTALEDTPTNRRKMEQVLKKIEAEITLGQFDYLAYFPNSKTGKKLVEDTAASAPPTLLRAGSSQLVRAEVIDEDVDCPTFDDFAKQWLMENEVRWRKSTLELQQSFLSRHLIPAFGERKVNSITKAEVLSFRSKLAKVPGLFSVNYLVRSATTMMAGWVVQFSTGFSPFSRAAVSGNSLPPVR